MIDIVSHHRILAIFKPGGKTSLQPIGIYCPYAIVLPSGDAVARDGVATSVLKWTNGKWQIISLHRSSRKPKS